MQLSSIPNSKLAVATAVLARFDKPRPTPVLLADLDLATKQDFSTFMLAIEAQAGPHCKTIELIDDGPIYTTEIRLLFRVETSVYTGRWESDEDGAYPDTEKWVDEFSLFVKPSTSLDIIALLVASEVRGIENNRFA